MVKQGSHGGTAPLGAGKASEVAPAAEGHGVSKLGGRSIWEVVGCLLDGQGARCLAVRLHEARSAREHSAWGLDLSQSQTCVGCVDVLLPDQAGSERQLGLLS